jgi:hypothetical protein
MKQLFFKKRANQQVVISQPVVERPLPSLGLCILMDFLGMASFGIPILGELFDLVWAPISGIIYYRMFGGRKGFFGGIFAFLEELLPGTDIIPTFTITWLIQYAKRKKNVIQVISR